jgi:hypothetical protein
MTSSQRPRESDTSRYRHGCDPPEKVKVASRSDCKGLDRVGPLSPASTHSMIRLIQLQPSLLALVFRFHLKRK